MSFLVLLIKKEDNTSFLDEIKKLKSYKNSFQVILSGMSGGSSIDNKVGYNYYSKIVSISDNLIAEGFDILYYKERLSEDEYDKNIQIADVLVAPVNIDYYSNQGWTAGMSESVNHFKQLLVPEKFDLHEDMRDVVLRFNNNNLHKILGNLIESGINNKNIKLVYMKKFSKDVLAKQFKNDLKLIFNH